MSNNVFAHTREAVRVKVKKCERNMPPEWRKFSVDPQITSLEVLYSLLAKAFDIKSDFSIKYKAYDPAGSEIYLAVLSDWDLDAAFLRAYNVSVQTTTEPCLMLQMDIKPFTDIKDWNAESTGNSSVLSITSNSCNTTPTSSTTHEVISPLQQSFGASQKYVQQMHTKLPGLIMIQMEKTLSMVQKAFNMNEEAISSLPPRQPLADEEFRMFLDALGQIQRCDELRKVIFFGGIDPSLRRVVWKHILNVYPSIMSGNQRMEYMRRKSEQYYKLRATWKTAVEQGYVVGELAYVTSMVKKDVLRTDRLHAFYAGSDDNQNIAALFNILTTYALNHPSVSYCQGMSDIASPLLVTMNDEAQAYICFCAIMSRVRGNFMLDGISMTQKFAHLTEALSFYDGEFWEYLKAQQADDLLFCYRWLLLELKREFPFEDALRMLEVQWSSLKYETSGEELKLYENEFVPTMETHIATDTCANVPTSSSNMFESDAPPIRENAYTKVCALRHKSSTVSLNSLVSSSSASTNYIGITDLTYSKLNLRHHLNQSLDENITRHGTWLQRRASSKAHQSLDETKILKLLKDKIDNDTDISDDCNHNDDDILNQAKFHDTNPFKKNDEDIIVNTGQDSLIPKTFLSSSSSSLLGDDYTSSGSVNEITFVNGSETKSFKIPERIARLQKNNILTNYSTVDNIIAKQLATNVSEGVKRVSSTGGGHFRDLKEKIAAASKKGLSIEEYNDKSQQKLVKNFNEFLNFAFVNKSRQGNPEHINACSLFPDNTSKKSKTPSPTHSQTSPTHNPCPVIQLTKRDFTESFDSDSSSLPEITNTTWSCSTAATAIQQANNLSNYSLQLELNSQLSSLIHTPEHTPEQYAPIATYKHQESIDCTAALDDNQDLNCMTMTTPIARQLSLQAENLDRKLIGDLFLIKKDGDEAKHAAMSGEIEYEKLGKNSLEMVDDIKEDEAYTCPETMSNTGAQRRHQHFKALATKPNESNFKNLLNEQFSNNLYNRDSLTKQNERKHHMVDVLKLNPFLNKSLHRDEIFQTTESPSNTNSCNNLYDIPANFACLPEVLVPISSTDAPDTTAIDEMATTAAEEDVALSTKAAQFANNSTNDSTYAPRLPPPSEFGGGNPFLMFLCLTLLLQHRNTIMKSNMDYNEIAMHFDKMVRKHDVTRVLNQARRMYVDYLKNQTTYNLQQNREQQTTHSVNIPQQPSDVNHVTKFNHLQKDSKYNSSAANSSITSPSFCSKSS